MPVVRRVASSSSTMNTTPTHTSVSVGTTARSPNVSPCAEDVADHADAGGRQQPVPPHDAVAEAPRHRIEQEGEEHHAEHVHRPHHVGRHDLVGGIEVEQRDAGSRSRRSPVPSQPPRRLAAPSSASISASTFSWIDGSASTVMAQSSCDGVRPSGSDTRSEVDRGRAIESAGPRRVEYLWQRRLRVRPGAV